jgi:chromate transporter
MNRMTAVTPINDRERTGSALEVLRAFAKLGVSCFGGPIAHIGYFRQEFVIRRRWLDEQAYADLVALCQFLPGPASSQVGFSLGLMRAGYLGGLAAWVAFTLPSAIALLLFAYGASALEGEIGSGLLHGLKLVAVAIVAQAVWGMARTLCPDRERASIAVVAALVILLSSSSLAQIGAIVFGGIAGLWLCRAAAAGTSDQGHMSVPVSRSAGVLALAVFFLLLAGLPILSSLTHSQAVALFERSIVPAPWSLAADTWCCPSCARRPSHRDGSVTMYFSRVMVPRRPCPGRSSLSRRISGQSWDHPRMA